MANYTVYEVDDGNDAVLYRVGNVEADSYEKAAQKANKQVNANDFVVIPTRSHHVL